MNVNWPCRKSSMCTGGCHVRLFGEVHNSTIMHPRQEVHSTCCCNAADTHWQMTATSSGARALTTDTQSVSMAKSCLRVASEPPVSATSCTIDSSCGNQLNEAQFRSYPTASCFTPADIFRMVHLLAIASLFPFAVNAISSPATAPMATMADLVASSESAARAGITICIK